MIEPHDFEDVDLGVRYRTLIPASDWWFAYALWGHETDRPPTVEWRPVVAWAILAPEHRYDDDRVVPLIVDEELTTPALCPAVDWRWECTSNIKPLGLYREVDRTDPAQQTVLQQRAEAARDDKRADAALQQGQAKHEEWILALQQATTPKVLQVVFASWRRVRHMYTEEQQAEVIREKDLGKQRLGNPMTTDDDLAFILGFLGEVNERRAIAGVLTAQARREQAAFCAPNDPTAPARDVWAVVCPDVSWPAGLRVEWAILSPRRAATFAKAGGFEHIGRGVYQRRPTSRITLDYPKAVRHGNPVEALLHEFTHAIAADGERPHGHEFRTRLNAMRARLGLPPVQGRITRCA